MSNSKNIWKMLELLNAAGGNAEGQSWLFYTPFMGWNKGQSWFGEKGCEIYSVCVGERHKYLYGARVCSIEQGVYLYKTVTYMFVFETSSENGN